MTQSSLQTHLVKKVAPLIARYVKCVLFCSRVHCESSGTSGQNNKDLEAQGGGGHIAFVQSLPQE